MTDETSHENANEQGGYERQDLQVSAVLYFMLGLIVVTMLGMIGLRGVFAYLEHREKVSQPPVSPLVTSVPRDTRHIAAGYPQSVFPSPKLEEDERGQLNGIRLEENQKLYSYGWVDENAGTLHIPIDRAMDLLVQRGLPVRTQDAGAGSKGEKK